MHDCQKIQEQLLDLVFGEFDDGQQAQVFAELEACQDCRAEYRSFTATLSTFDKAADLMLPDEAYWDGYQARLQTRLVANESVSLWQRLADFTSTLVRRPAFATTVSPLFLILLLWFLLKQPAPVPIGQPPDIQVQPPSITGTSEPGNQSSGTKETGGITTIDSTGGVKGGFQISRNKGFKNHSTSGRKFEPVADRQPDVQKQIGQPEFAPAVSVSEFDYIVRNLADDETVKHFEKAQNLLRSFRNLNFKASASRGEIADEKSRSRSLLLKNVLLRREAETRANLPIEQVLSALEPLLIDIAHLPDGASQSEIRAIRERIQRKEMIGKLQLYSARPLIAETTID